ncbi:hypothetical protein KIW84_050062 [Lathyrus oleraceus]|uniref:Uncharacterized protein n=1 Tax=Pisum sativum TaxID=3888 RepID=A0A9D4WIN5_PEA|nr:hypothetical protein KIW84_050062 [Pisum sativum]
MSWINISVESKIAQSILWMDIAIEMWIELKDDSYQGDVFRISDIQEEICTLKQVRSQIVSMDPLHNICRVYRLLVQQKREVVLPLDESKVLAFPNQNQSSQYKHNLGPRGRGTRCGRSYSGRDRRTRVFTYCGTTNHTFDSCFKINGVPPH